MSKLTNRRQSAPPSVPGTGYVSHFVNDLTGMWAVIDEFGTVSDYLTSSAPLTMNVRNQSGSTIPKGTVLTDVGDYLPGIPLVEAADKDDPTHFPAIAIAQSDIFNGTTGVGVIVGGLIGLDTSAFAERDVVVVGNSGALSLAPPGVDPFTGFIQPVAIVAKSHLTNGELLVKVNWPDVVDATQVFYGLEVTQTGLVSGGAVTKGSGLTVDVAAGTGFIADSGTLTRVTWTAVAGLAVPAAGTFRVQIDPTGTVSIAGTGYPPNRIILAFGYTDTSDVVMLAHHALQLAQLGLQFHNYGRDAIGPINVSGQVASINGGTGLDIAVTSGVFYIDTHRLSSASGAPITFRYWYRDGLGGWTTVAGQTVVDPSLYDDGSGTLAAVPSGEFKRDLLLCNVNDGGTEFHVIYGQETFSSQGAAEVGDNPAILSFLNSNAVRIAAIIEQEGSANIASIIDQRPRIGQFAADSGSGDHATLADLEWTASGHTGSVPSTVAAFDGTGAAELLPFSAPSTNLSATTANATGTASSVSRSDHGHAITTVAPGATSVATAPAAGSSASLARADHVHQSNTAASTIQPDDTATVGTSGEPARADHKHAIAAAAPSATGVATASAEGASTSFARADHVHQANTAPADVTKAAAAIGTSGEPARADHKHDVTTAAPGTIQPDDTANEGTATSLARSDHRHAIAAASPGASSVATAAAEGASTSFARADHLHQSNTAPVDVTKAAASIGTSGEPARADHKHDVSTAVAGTIQPDDAAAEGTATSLSRSDHKHAIVAAAPAATGVATASAEGVATSFARSDHAHQSNTAPSDVTKAAAAIGTSGEPARADHKHDVSTAAPGTIQPDDSANEGTATSLARSDHRHAIAAAAPGATGVATASAEGASTSFARADHAHQSNTAASTIQPDDTATVGTSGEPARADHKHAIVAAAPGATGVATASAEGTSTSFARADHAHQSNTAPVNVTKAAAAIGTSGEPARADHKHDVTTAVASATGGANAEGSSTSLARADHGHQVTSIVESSGPTALAIGAVADGQRLRRSGANLVGVDGGSPVQWGNDSVSATTTTRYLSLGASPNVADTVRTPWVAPAPGVVDFLRMVHDIAGGNANAIVYTVRKNGAVQTLTVSIPATTTTVVSDTTHAFIVAAGDLVDIEITKAASVGTSPSKVSGTFRFTPT